MLIEKVTIIGVGLIGGSFGLALNHRQLVAEVTGFDANPENIRLALSAGAIHKEASSLAQAVTGANLVVLATPVLTSEKILSELTACVMPHTIITDVGSTKESIVARAHSVLPGNVYYVGGHPMAGSEIAGMKGADPYLFENAYYLLTPTKKTYQPALQAVRALVESTGARVVEMSPREHDHNVAVVSHLPHLVATALVNTLNDMPGCRSMIPLAAGGFRDTTRIAAGSPVMWRDILASNRRRILKVMQCFRSQWDEYEQQLKDEDYVGLLGKLERAKKIREALPARGKGYLPQQFEILITVPDRPGVIAHFSTLLGENGVNMTDLEILRVREGQGGTIRLAFATEKEQKMAIELLVQAGYQAHNR